ncbi:hypothetical protein [Nonomuraea turcica]|uniref:hypothetical protein n=1 Tax=Nonomuraea sp. G32 TaxID=3067274 RepID=UPI00273C21C2|nr:hypothetical protein [Nonomuraea sp. G32]MDP4510299.1 hypothetical protein [Nonomuraea sp. G32]
MTMGARGFVGFVADKVEKISYTHDDSYPAGVGLGVLAWLRTAMQAPQVLRQRVAAVRVVSPDSSPTQDDIERLGTYTDTLSSTAPGRHWWELLWRTQGEPEAILEAGVIVDAGDLPANSHCEWGYVVDLDSMVFEVYRGQQPQPHNRGRFVTENGPRDHCPAALVTGWPLDQLPNEEEFLDALSAAS